MKNQPKDLGSAYPRRVTLYDDGKYRWVYEMKLFRNPTIFLLIWKIFFFIFAGIFLVMMVADAIQWSDFFPDRFLTDLKILGYFVAGMTVLVGVSYAIYALIMGGSYIVEFDMDENGVNHRQIAAQAQKARALGTAAALTGLAAGQPGAIGAGIASQRTEMYSEFAKARSVKAKPALRVIKIRCGLESNQVYACPEDFAFVKEYIISRCPNLMKKP